MILGARVRNWIRKPAPSGLAKVIEGSFEHRRGERRFHVERRLVGIAEAMPVTRRHDHGLPGCQGGAFITRPTTEVRSVACSPKQAASRTQQTFPKRRSSGFGSARGLRQRGGLPAAPPDYDAACWSWRF
jgi:hypothetical protein